MKQNDEVFDEHGVARPGAIFRVPLAFMDAQQRRVAASSKAQEADEVAEAAYETHKAMLTTAWQGNQQPKYGPTSREDYVAKLGNAWRGQP